MKAAVVTPEQCTFLSHEINTLPCKRCGNTDEIIICTHNGTGRLTGSVHIECRCGYLTGFGKLKKAVLSELRKIRK